MRRLRHRDRESPLTEDDDKGHDSDGDVWEEDGGTSLILAVEEGHEALVLLLLDNGADISATQAHGVTALHAAARSGHSRLAEMLISRGIDISTKDEMGKTALHHAARWGQAETAQILLKSKANPLAEDHEGNTAVHEAAVSGHEEVLKLLLEHVGKGDETEQLLATTRLRRAVDQAEKDEVRSLLEKGADPNLVSQTDLPLLHLAIAREDDDVLQPLLTNKASVSMKDRFGRTPLHWAACRGYDVGVRLLLEHGADIRAADTDGATPLHWATTYGNATVVKRLLDNGSPLDMKDKNEQTALAWLFKPFYNNYHYFMVRGGDGLPEEEREDEEQRAKRYLDILELLIERGADLNEPLPYWGSILPLAACSHQGLTRLALLRRVIEAGGDVAAQTEDGTSSLYLAASDGEIEAVRLLLKHGADPNQGNKRHIFILGRPEHHGHGMTALH
ncbi:uncharacterized protein PV07_07698 [Cladophialophora immunda]|uniref:Uncharacterized protein n=1 Tax=Cladophialophora immunda TaxID=569365 RepID=A0A0D1ZJ94_9EURO|nr:uncharacterized protein PV07_07698 [Cladophialophora immunda]KIW28006.1 hypothetical protein PV07_07698 [Cladophialophora immunda]